MAVMLSPASRQRKRSGNFAATVRGIVLGISLSYVVSVWIGGSGFNKEESLFSSGRSLAKEEKYYKEEQKEEEEMDDTVVATSIVCIIILLIALTIAFEEIEELILESSPLDMRPIVESLFGEMTVLGFLSVCTFVITKTPFPYSLSERLFGEEEFLVEVFEMVHFSLFFIMLFFVGEVLVLLKDGIKTEKNWLALDRAYQERRYGGEPSESNQELDSFAAIREEFVLERSMEPPFEPAPLANRVSDDFNFGRYLSICFGITVSHVVHVDILSWVLFIVLTLGFYCIMLALDNNLVALAWIWAGLGWLVYLLLIVAFERYLSTIAKALAAPDSSDHAGGEQEPLLRTSPNNETNALLPAWCHVDLDQYMFDRSWLLRRLCPKIPNRQDTLFWFEKKGPHVHFLVLQFTLVFLGIYGALLILTFFPTMVVSGSTLVLVAYMAVALLPVLVILLRIRQVVTVMTIVGSIGALRRPQVVSDVIRKEKTQLVVRAFLVLDRMHRLAMQPDGEDHQHAKGEHHELTRLETVAVGATFDAFDRSGDGMLSIKELDRVMHNLGGSSNEKLERMLSALDVNGDGNVSKPEFLDWYARYMVHDHEDMSLHDRAHALFHMFDKNDSGEISIGEFKRTLDAFDIGFSVDEIGQIVNELDEDGNIMIGFEEFHELVEKYYPGELEGE